MVDFRWTSLGGVLLDDQGDLALASPRESLQDMVQTRLKADLNGWKLYPIGADLSASLGEAVTSELELAIKRRVQQSLQKQFLPKGMFTITTVTAGSEITVYVYLQDSLVASVLINTSTGSLKVS